MMRAQTSAQEQVVQLQAANHEAQAYWDNKSQIMLMIARTSNEDPGGAKERIEEILQSINKKYPTSLRKLASNSESLHHLQRALLRRFRADLLSKNQLLKYRLQLGEKLKQYYSLEADQLEKMKISVHRGETLVKLSREYYHNPRRWTELYLLNQEHIPNWDILEVGTSLDIYLPKELAVQLDNGDRDQTSAY